MVGDAHDHAHVVLDQEDADAELVADLAQQLPELGGFARIEPGGRLVQAEQPGLRAHRPRDLELALLAVRQIGGVPVGVPDEAGARQPLAREHDRLRLGPPVGGEAQHAE